MRVLFILCFILSADVYARRTFTKSTTETTDYKFFVEPFFTNSEYETSDLQNGFEDGAGLLGLYITFQQKVKGKNRYNRITTLIDSGNNIDRFGFLYGIDWIWGSKRYYYGAGVFTGVINFRADKESTYDVDNDVSTGVYHKQNYIPFGGRLQAGVKIKGYKFGLFAEVIAPVFANNRTVLSNSYTGIMFGKNF
jgi:hypothetical protein